MIERVDVIGAHGRVGSAVSGRLREREVALGPDDPGLVLLCVPDRAIADVAAGLPPGPWVAHVSGGTPLAALAPHVRRFSVHPLQTFTKDRGPEQLDGAWAAVTGETDEARGLATELAELLGLRPFVLEDDRRALYHAGATIAASYLVTLRRVAGDLLSGAGVPPEAVDPLMRRVVENGFQPTGPIPRGDLETIDRHRAAIGEHAPDVLEAYDHLAALTARDAVSQGSPA
jgi:predicted short-subunit dehydrogenase-like oxidoreductase (DUF2520 family)